MAPQPSRDPLSVLIAPSETETPEERDRRVQREEEAKHISNAIDEELNRERKVPKPAKVNLVRFGLLLIDCLSLTIDKGKSTTLKNFQLMHSPKVPSPLHNFIQSLIFGRERGSWRGVIYLNIVRSFHSIMDAMERVYRNDPWPEDDSEGIYPSDLPILTSDHLKIKRRLSPLLYVEQMLLSQICPSSPVADDDRIPDSARFSLKEVAVNSTTQWKEGFSEQVKGQQPDSQSCISVWDDPDDPGRLLHACCDDMIRLWNDPIVQKLLFKLRIRLGDHAAFFLDSLERVTAPKYFPTDDDILRARLKTLGVSEHRFRVNTGGGIGKDWRIYDVGGHRSKVTAWVPFFDDVDAIIFLAPISAFDQTLEEDPKVNRLFDSFQLWSGLTSNELLSRTNLILFLNKFDIFREKIEAGVPLAHYVTSYRDRPNDVESTSDYLSISSLFNVKDKIVLVTGGGSGIGKMMAAGFAQNGANVYIAARKEKQLQEAVVDIRKVAMGKVDYIVANVGSKAGCDALIQEFRKRESKLHVLVNNSGITWGGPFHDYPEERGWDNVFNVNVKSIFYMTAGLTDLLAKGGGNRDPGRVINISSTASVDPLCEGSLSDVGNGTWSYQPSKAAVNHLTSALALKLGPQHITYVSLPPLDVFPSKMTAFGLKKSGEDAFNSNQPSGRFGRPEDVAGLALFLASPASAHITGTHTLLDGGARYLRHFIAPATKL
ncbi:Rhamnolipids biosynthesis 3-oxoacyl-[acyl-carrier-protein] reductase [Leucoagaricus sp. SymC.cos]|nr:Rhamnolipids biosynthesis 3-oxoacyl-[acyl-carrier-protein] reductase [Leucoagaricus sp. SymC.cos]